MDNLSGGFLALVITFLFVLAVLWFILPFAVFGIKYRLDDLIRETKRTNSLLNSVGLELVAQRPSVKAPPPSRERVEPMYTS